MRQNNILRALLCCAVGCAIGCGAETGKAESNLGAASSSGTSMPVSGINGAAGMTGLPTGGSVVAGTMAPPLAGAMAPPLAGTMAPPIAGTMAPPVAGDMAPPVAGTMAPPVAGTTAPPPAGPEDGDPSGPIVAAPGVPCGPNPSLFGLTTTNVTIGGRGVHVAYPCNKHKGAPVTFILNLHGTMPTEDLKVYQVAYFSANNLVDSHNFITAAPKAIGSQWGNGDGGADLPHIMEVIDWVYSTFADFDIRGMWVSGHSWGAMYSTNFACSAAVEDKVVGAMLESGSGMAPACASRISVISSAAETDIGPVINQGGTPASHGCGAELASMVGNNNETYWPNCDLGFTHANYLMLGKGHSDYMDAEVVTRIGDLIKAARR